MTDISYILSIDPMMSSMKPAPLQFVKLAPSDLYRSAQDQLNKAAVVTKPKPKEFDAEWQSDLDNWKSNRRKQQEHIIERLVEVKKFETDRLDDGFRKRSKTFNEMIQERGKSGRLRSLPALYQDDDDGNDLSDLGLSAGKKSDCVDGGDDDLQPHRRDASEERSGETCGNGGENDVFRCEEKSADTDAKTAAAENGFDRAIKDYVDFAESKRTSSATAAVTCDGRSSRRKPSHPAAEPKRRMSAPKIEEKVMLLKTRSKSARDLHSAAVAELPKVDIVKRREIFEKAAAAEVLQQQTVVAPRHQQAPLIKRKPLEMIMPSAAVVSVGRLSSGDRDIQHQVIEEMSPPGSPPSPSGNDESTTVADQRQPLKLQLTSFGEEEAPVDKEAPPPPQQHYGLPDAATAQQEAECIADETAQRPTADDQEKPIVALEKERVQLLRDDGYGILHHVHHQQLSSLSDPASRHSVDSLDMHECGGLADPDDGNYPGSCVSAEDSGIHTEDMSSCVSQADDEEQRSNLQPSPPAHHQHLQQHHHLQPPDVSALPRHDQLRHVDDAYSNMVLELTPVNALEPPKEKPPPPPIDEYSDDDQMQPSQEFIVDSMESAKRIKKEMWMKRSSFLGLEEYTNGGYEHDLENLKSKPPDLTSFLEEERRLEKLLYNQNKPDRHDNSRIYENVSSVPTQNVYVDDGDNESSQYMRDILQVEEQSRCNQLKNKAAQNNIGEKLVKKLKELEEDLNNQESARVGSAHWLPPTRHSMQDISTTDGVVVNPPRPPLDHTQSMPNLEQPVHGQHHQSEDFTWSAQNICSKPSQQSIYAKRKPINSQPEKYNYQHWLIQEAEHRRLVDKCNRQIIPPGAIASNQPRSRSRPALPPPPPPSNNKKPLPDSVINTLTQRVQDRLSFNDFQRHDHISNAPQESMLSVSGKKKCSHCSIELGRGAAMIIESLQLFYHIECFKCCVCCVQLGDGLMGTDVRVRNKKLHCHNCFSSDDGVKFSCV